MDDMLLVQICHPLQHLQHNALDLSHGKVELHIDHPLQIMLQVLKHEIEAPSHLVLFGGYKKIVKETLLTLRAEYLLKLDDIFMI